MNIEGKAAIVTGGGTGVGRATAIALAELGCSVLVNYSRSKEAAEKTAAEVSARGVKGVAFRADVSNDEDCRAMVAERFSIRFLSDRGIKTGNRWVSYLDALFPYSLVFLFGHATIPRRLVNTSVPAVRTSSVITTTPHAETVGTGSSPET